MSGRAAIVGCAGLLAACSSPETSPLPGRVPALASPARPPPPVPSDIHAPPLARPPPPVPSDIHAPPLARPPPPVPSDIPAPPLRGPLELAFVGDIILGKYRLNDYASLVTPGEDPFAAVAGLLRADIAVANLETPLMHTRPPRSPIYIGSRFGADKQAARALIGAFKVLGVANNHAHDLLTAGLQQTPEVLRELGLVPVGAAQATGDPVQVVTLEQDGWRVALVAATTWTNRPPEPGDPALPVYRTSQLPRRLLPAIAAARPEHDLVLVLLHWGQEYTDGPDHQQRAAARRLIDGGADLVIGHHPHVLHGLERHGDGLIAYSLGNFLFANTDERSRHSGVLRVRYRPGQRCPERASFHPVWLGEAPKYAPTPAPAPRAAEIHKRMKLLAKRLRTPLIIDGEALVVQGWPCSPATPPE